MEDQRKKKSRKGKKNWRRNIDTKEIEDKLVSGNKEKDAKEQYEQIKKKIAKTQTAQLFTVDSDKPRSRRAPLNPDRFKKKAKVEVPLKADIKIVNRITRNKQAMAGPQPTEEKEENLEWKQTDEGRREYKHILPQNEVASVVMPHGGQSYNPSYQQHQELLDSIVLKEQDLDKIKVFGSKKVNKAVFNQASKKIKKLKNAKAQKALDEQLAQKKQRQLKNEASHLQVFSKEIDRKNQEIREKHKIAEEKKEFVKSQKKKGIVDKQRFGKHRYEMRETEFQAEKDLTESLRQMKPMNELNIKERFDSIYRRGILEKSEPWRAKPKPRVPRFKVTDLNRRRDDIEDEQLGDFSGAKISFM